MYVDDIKVATKLQNIIETVKEHLSKNYEFTETRPVSYFLGVKVIWKNSAFFLTQRGYLERVLNEYEMMTCKPANTPIDPGSYTDLTRVSSDADRALTSECGKTRVR